MLLDIFRYSFMLRGLEAGTIVAIIAPAIGIFLVLKHYSLIADTLSHVSLAGIAIGLIAGFNPVVTAIFMTVVCSIGVEKLRSREKIYGESALAILLSGSLALAIVLLSLARGFNSNLFSYLFGSIVTVTEADVYTIFILAIITGIILSFFYKELIYVTFDETSARVSGLPTKLINNILIILTALTVSLSIPIVGVLLISALLVIPISTALQLKKGFTQTIIYAEIMSLVSVITGMVVSFYLNLSTGGTIVLVMLAILALTLLYKKTA